MSEKKNNLSDNQKRALAKLHADLMKRSSQIKEPDLREDGIRILDGECTKEYLILNRWYNEERKKILNNDY